MPQEREVHGYVHTVTGSCEQDREAKREAEKMVRFTSELARRSRATWGEAGPAEHEPVSARCRRVA
jgi:hypothetical protein